MSTNLDIALAWLDQGIATIPIGYRSKRPDRRHLMNGEWREFQTRLPTKHELECWFSSPLQNIAVVMRHKNLVCCDFDNLIAHDLWLNWIPESLLKTHTVKTARGYHYYYHMESSPDYTMKWIGGEIKASGYCLCPPSIHPNGKPYVAINQNFVCGVESVDDLFPPQIIISMSSNARVFKSPSLKIDPWNPPSPHHIQGFDLTHLKMSVPILSFFPDARRSGNGWYSVKCPFHDDRHASGWIDPIRNRYGCAKCVTGSMSVIDFYMALSGADFEAAIKELAR